MRERFLASRQRSDHRAGSVSDGSCRAASVSDGTGKHPHRPACHILEQNAPWCQIGRPRSPPARVATWRLAPLSTPTDGVRSCPPPTPPGGADGFPVRNMMTSAKSRFCVQLRLNERGNLLSGWPKKGHPVAPHVAAQPPFGRCLLRGETVISARCRPDYNAVMTPKLHAHKTPNKAAPDSGGQLRFRRDVKSSRPPRQVNSIVRPPEHGLESKLEIPVRDSRHCSRACCLGDHGAT